MQLLTFVELKKGHGCMMCKCRKKRILMTNSVMSTSNGENVMCISFLILIMSSSVHKVSEVNKRKKEKEVKKIYK